MCHPPTLRVVEFLFIVITAVYILVRVRRDTEFAAAAGNDTAAPHTSDVEATPAAAWALPGEAATKAGAGLLLFAYGSDAYTLNHFLGEAAFAAQSFKAHNPELQIAVVTNNASVDRTLFSHVLRPRPDLLFPGSPCPYEKDPAKAATCTTYQTRRQWATRLYYMALSPFELTWALDSNVVSCTPGAAGRFLSAALASELWGLDIAHANGPLMTFPPPPPPPPPPPLPPPPPPRPPPVTSPPFLPRQAAAASSLTTGTSPTAGARAPRPSSVTGSCCS